MVLCVVFGCSKRSGRDKDVSFFRIPRIIYNKGEQVYTMSKKRRDGFLATISRVGLTEKILNNDRVCSRHFHSGKPAALLDDTNPDWLPSLDLGHVKSGCSANPTKRWERRKAREAAQNLMLLNNSASSLLNETADTTPPPSETADTTPPPSETADTTPPPSETADTTPPPSETADTTPPPSESADTTPPPSESADTTPLPSQSATPVLPSESPEATSQPNESAEIISMLSDNESTSNILVDTSTQTEECEELERLKCTVEDLMMRITPPPFSEETFTKDEYVKFYTGLPNLKVLKAVFRHVLAVIPASNSKLKPFQEFVAVLMKLRLNTQMQDLAYRFNVSVATISRIFLKWIRALDGRLRSLIFWPDRDALIDEDYACKLPSFFWEESCYHH